jgi:hypothetical protein
VGHETCVVETRNTCNTDNGNNQHKRSLVRFEVFKSVKMALLLFWVVTSCGLFNTEDGDSMFLRNVGFYLRVHMASQPRRDYLVDVGVYGRVTLTWIMQE